MNAPTSMNALAKLPPHRLVRGFLGEDLIERLLAHADANQHAFHPTRMADGSVDPTARISRRLTDFGPLRAELDAKFRGILEWAVEQLHMTPFELDALELELVAHGDGAFFQRHIDTLMDPNAGAGSRRTLTGVLYFHALPKGYEGGEIRVSSLLPPEDGGTYVDVVPERDLLLLFPSWIPHEVRPVRCPDGGFQQSRFAVDCWYLRRP